MMKLTGLVVGIVASGIISAASLSEWFSITGEHPRAVIKEFAQQLPPEVIVEHHNVYAKVGEKLWEENVKPEFARAMILKTIADTGDVIPSTNVINNWIREHSKDAKNSLKEFGEEFKKTPPSPEKYGNYSVNPN